MQSPPLCPLILHLAIVIVGTISVSPLNADEVDFDRDIRPILSDKCYTCHGPDANTRQADLRLDNQAGLLHSGVIEPGDISNSELIRRVTSSDSDERMPPTDSKLSMTKTEVDQLKRWIASGAEWSGHWSFTPPIRPRLPIVKASDWPLNPIDRFVLARLEQKNLQPNKSAEKRRLIRRVSFDLNGLPPSPSEIDEFLANESADAYRVLVERLMASPRFGERMAWPWLEAARYADSNGFQGDNERSMWPWRDWAIKAINENMPYDQFTIWQLAGDLLPDATEQQRLATGFCRNHMINGEGGRIPEENRVEYVFDQSETVGTIWMGLTVQCCRCHDHKFDPISQQEYFQLFAFFNQTPVDGSGRDPATKPIMRVANRDQKIELDQLQPRIKSGRERLAKLEPAIKERCSQTELPEKVRKAIDTKIESRNKDHLNELTNHFKEDADYLAALQALREPLEREDQITRTLPRVMIMEDRPKEKQRKTFILNKGLYNQKRDEVSANTPTILPPLPADNRDRLALAKWLVDEKHPLTARVTVNRIWQTFFGYGLVKTVDDFGSQGEKPSHPELLDWLAVELVESGWDIKHIVRLIVTSRTYQQSAKAPAEQIKGDPQNRLLRRGPRHRLASWMIRDQALAASGLLVELTSGPPVKTYQPDGVWEDATFGKKRYSRDKGENLYRRSLYVFWRRIIGPTIFFDVAKRQTCSVKNFRTNTPLHALATLNDVTYVEAARVLAENILISKEDDAGRIALTLKRVVGREPTAQEQQLLLARIEKLKQHFGRTPGDANDLLAVGESKRNGALNATEHAAWTSVCLMILNLDEALNN